MNKNDFMVSVAADIEHQLYSFEERPSANIPSAISPALAVALLQKSIRRGRSDLAQAAAMFLLQVAPDRLWRRLTIVAIEDVGVADLDGLYLTTVAASHRRRLAAQFGAQRLIGLIVARLALAPKCRSADDLAVAAHDFPGSANLYSEFQQLPLSDLLSVIASDAVIAHRAIALRYAMSISSTAVFDLLWETTPHTLAEVARTAHRQTREYFCAFMPLLHQQCGWQVGEVRSDPLPAERIINGLPSWALDKFTREGRTALSLFLNTDCATTTWLREHISAGGRKDVLAHALFRVESGLVVDRLIWPVGDDLRRQADLCRWGFSADEAATLLALVKGDIPLLNDAREQSYGR